MPGEQQGSTCEPAAKFYSSSVLLSQPPGQVMPMSGASSPGCNLSVLLPPPFFASSFLRPVIFGW